jgi:4-carboxymuconolactone decarboxylase
MRDAWGSVQALTAGQAAVVDVSAASASGDAASVERESGRAIDAGLSPAALYEIILQSYLFVGFPRAIEAFFAARQILERAAAIPPAAAPDDSSAWERAGEALCRKVYGRNYKRLMETMRALSPDLAASMIREGYGKTLSRPALGVVEREYGVIAILTVTRMWRQLRSHAIGAVNVGGTRAGVREAIERCRTWAGGDVVQEALRAAGMEDDRARR